MEKQIKESKYTVVGAIFNNEYKNLDDGGKFEEFKQRLIKEINALNVEGMPKVEKLNALVGGYVNLEYRLPNGKTVEQLGLDIFVGKCFVARHRGNVTAADARTKISACDVQHARGALYGQRRISVASPEGRIFVTRAGQRVRRAVFQDDGGFAQALDAVVA